MKGFKINKAAMKKAAPELAGAFIGGAAGGFVRKTLTNIIPANYQNQTVMNGAPLVLGVILGTQKDPLISGIGKGLCALSGQGFGAQMGLGDPYLGEVPQYIEIEGLDDGPSQPVLGNPGGELSY